MDTASKGLAIEENGEWLKDMRGNLAMVATVNIATMTFQVGLNPPGGIVQNEKRGYLACPTDQETEEYACPGESVFAAAYIEDYFYFMLFNDISSFRLSLCVSGNNHAHLSHQPCSHLQLSGTYTITLDNIWSKSTHVSDKSIKVWFVALGIVGFLLVTRFVLLFVAIFTKGSNAASTTPSETQLLNRT